MEGFMGYIISVLIIGFVLYSILDISPIILLIGGVSTAFFQSIPLKINNNLLIPLFSSFIMAVMLGLGLWVFFHWFEYFIYIS